MYYMLLSCQVKYPALTRIFCVKLEALTAVQSSRKEIELGPRPGQRIRSGVVVPPNLLGSKNATSSAPAELNHDLENSDDELERDLEDIEMFGKPALLNNMIDLDGSSDVEDGA